MPGRHYMSEDAAPLPPKRLEHQCRHCDGTGDSFNDPEFHCWYCSGTGLRFETDEEYQIRLDGEQHQRELFEEARRLP